ncbi:hypothetical protein BH23GEM6_BH23GEM6_15570 [soil metagenome]
MTVALLSGGIGIKKDRKNSRVGAVFQANKRTLRGSMRKHTTIAALILSLPLSALVAACGDNEDTQSRQALERESLERELELALQPDTTIEPVLNDVALEQPEVSPQAPPRASVTPAPAPRRTPPPAQRAAPRATTPAPAPAPQPSQPRTVTVPVPSGTTMALRMNQEISTRNSSVGSTFTATLTEAIIGSDGRTVIPAGATVRGTVTGARESSRAGEEASISIAFNSIAFDGQTYPINATTVSAPSRLVTRDSNTEKAAKIGGGAAAGAVLGQVIGRNTKSTIAGAAIGAAAGTAVAIGTANVDAVISSGTRVTIRLNGPVQVRRTV